jgi:TetR/AcrR family transcriptional repressor of nem operon
MRENGILRATADAEQLSTFMLGALQGGLLLCQTRKDVASLETTLDIALDHLRTWAV